MPDETEGTGGFEGLDPEALLPEPDDSVLDGLADEVNAIDQSFDERYVDAFDGLIYLGALSKEFEWLGHRFVIRTLSTNELLHVGLIVKEYADTVVQGRAYASAMVALATMSVDDEQLPTPVMSHDNGSAWAHQRFNYVTSRWFPYTIDKVYSEYLELDKQASDVIEQMGKASG